MIAHTWTLKIRAPGDRQVPPWPGICLTNRQIWTEATPIICRYSAFEARVKDMDFSYVIRSTQWLRGPCRKALIINPRLTILIDQYNCKEWAHKDIY